jgi:hypothetical protein
MEMPLALGSPMSQGQLQFQQQQSFPFQMPSSSRNSSPGSLAREQEHARQVKRSRGPDEEDDNSFGWDIGMEHEGSEKESKAKP